MGKSVVSPRLKYKMVTVPDPFKNQAPPYAAAAEGCTAAHTHRWGLYVRGRFHRYGSGYGF